VGKSLEALAYLVLELDTCDGEVGEH